MAQKVTTTITDDIDAVQGIETPASETITFSFAGKNYEIDLSKENATTMRENFGFYAEHAREVSGGHSAPRRPRQRNRAHSGDVRAWAQAQGITLSDRGRIPEAIVAQYEAAH